MKKRQIFFFIFVMTSVVLISAFAHKQNKNRKIISLKIQYVQDAPLFLNDSLVNKLLIQKAGYKQDQLKDELDLSMLESWIEKHPAVAETEVFTYPDGKIEMRIQEREPFLKIENEKSFFLDRNGVSFSIPYPMIDSLPKVQGSISESEFISLVQIIETLQEDPFIRQNRIEIIKHETGYSMALSNLPFIIEMGQVDNLSIKINKLKAYQAYLISQKEPLLPKRINLAFKGQVVTSN